MMNKDASAALAAWEAALQEQRDAERKFAAAHEKEDRQTILALSAEVDALRTRADLLLAEAVKTMRSSQP
jgi:hypothetical protein